MFDWLNGINISLHGSIARISDPFYGVLEFITKMALYISLCESTT
jgi:hypothetical protein